MLDDEELAMLIYTHSSQLTLIDIPAEQAFALACRVAVLAFDPGMITAGLERAREAIAAQNAKRQEASPDGPKR